ncbi:MAG: aspartate aminotransferase family protein [Actinomycetota bacterium]|nr:aspartate aminotransferase family protein [Actinomycetota bacterium]
MVIRADAPAYPVPTRRSEDLFRRASRVTPGGVHGEGRTARPFPLFIVRGDGSRVWDADGNEYVDFHAGFGAILLGHRHPAVTDAVHEVLATHGPMFAAASDLEVELAERIVDLVPCAEKVIFSCTGTEATYHAIRVARAVSGREKILKFEGHYHGWHDYVSWSTHFAPAATRPEHGTLPPAPASSGIPGTLRDLVVVCEYNDGAGVEAAFERHGADLAAVIVEPVFHNGGVIEPAEGFLERLRELCSSHGSLLIFDEVITGFRDGLGGAQERLGVTPDLTTMGKAIANGFPLSVVAGRADVMDAFVPQGDVLYAGTFTAQPVTVAAGLACTAFLRDNPVHERLATLGTRVREGIEAAIEETGADAQVRQRGSTWALYFTRRPINRYRDIADAIGTKDNELHAAYRRSLLEDGIYVHPHYLLRGYLTASHSDEEIERTIEATRSFLHANGGSRS